MGLAISLKRYPDTNPFFSANLFQQACEAVSYSKPFMRPVLVHRCAAASSRGRIGVEIGCAFGVVNLFHGVHAAVGLGEQTLDLKTIFWTERSSDAQSNQIASANFASRFDRQLVQAAGFFTGGFRIQTGRDDHEFIAAHAGNVVVATADFL